MNPAVLDQVGNWILLACAPAIWVFTFLYGTFSRWRSTLPGKALFHMALAMSLVLLLAMVTVVTGYDWPGRLWMRIGVFAYLTFTFWWMLGTLVRILRRSGTID